MGQAWTNLVLNGREFGHKFTSKNVDYWSTLRPKPEDAKFNTRNYGYLMTYDENEERILSTIPSINQASKYILEAHIFIDNPSKMDRRYIKFYLEIQDYAKRRSIPVYWYTEESPAKLMNKSKALRDISHLNMVPEENPYVPIERDYTRWLERINWTIEIANATSFNQLSKDAQKAARDIKYGWDRKEYATQLKNDVHNYKTERNQQVVDTIYKLSKVMRKYKVMTIDQLLEKLAEKFNDPI
jgi:hypothetical protein